MSYDWQSHPEAVLGLAYLYVAYGKDRSSIPQHEVEAFRRRHQVPSGVLDVVALGGPDADRAACAGRPARRRRRISARPRGERRRTVRRGVRPLRGWRARRDHRVHANRGGARARIVRTLLARPRGTLPGRPPLGATHWRARWRSAEPHDPRLSRGRVQQPPEPLVDSEGRKSVPDYRKGPGHATKPGVVLELA